MNRLIDLTGKRFGNWTVISYLGGKKWHCKCDCGTEKTMDGQVLRKGISTHCGCMRERIHEGDRFGKLTAIKKIRKDGNVYWECVCDCGNRKEIKSDYLLRGTLSCGCLISETNSGPHGGVKHDEHGVRIARAYSKMRERCYSESCPAYNHYGGRGIKICDEWLGKSGLRNFYNWAIANGYDSNLSIDRIDVNGNYEPSNCRWIPMSEQNSNKRNNVLIEAFGEKHIASEWEKITGINAQVITKRFRGGVKDSELFKKPEGKSSKRKGREIVYNGERHTAKEWADILNIPYSSMRYYICKDMTIDEIKERRLYEQTRRKNDNLR